jgi:hypothetical protein
MSQTKAWRLPSDGSMSSASCRASISYAGWRRRLRFPIKRDQEERHERPRAALLSVCDGALREGA